MRAILLLVALLVAAAIWSGSYVLLRRRGQTRLFWLHLGISCLVLGGGIGLAAALNPEPTDGWLRSYGALGYMVLIGFLWLVYSLALLGVAAFGLSESERPLPGQEVDDMRLIRRVGWGAAGTAVVGATVFWLGWVRAPTPEQVCAHKIQLVVDSTPPQQREGADALVGQLEARCLVAAQRKLRLRGKLVWARYAKCVTSATHLRDAERC